MYTTLNKIRKCEPRPDLWAKLLNHLGKTSADDEPLSIATIIDSNGVEDAIWCLRAVEGHDEQLILFTEWCARYARALITSISAQRISAYREAKRTGVSPNAFAASWVANLVVRLLANSAVGRAATYAEVSTVKSLAKELRRICEKEGR